MRPLLGIALLLAVVCTGPSPSTARGLPGLTAAEIAETKELLAAFTTGIAPSGSCLADALVYDDVEMAASNRYLGGKIRDAWLSHTNATAYLLAMNPFVAGQAAFNNFETEARSSQVATAFGHRNNAATYAQAVVDGASAALLLTSKPAAWLTAMRCVKTNMARAKTLLNGVNGALTYTNARNLLWWPRVVGPHASSWVLATNLGIFSMITLNASLESASGGLLPAYDVRALSEPAWSRGALAQMKAALKTMMGDIAPRFYNYLYNMALIPLDATQCGFSPMHLVGRSFEQILLHCNDCSITTAGNGGPVTGTPFFFTAQLQTWFDAIRADLATRPLAFAKWDRFIFDFMTAWRDSDGAINAAFAFPTPTTLDSLRVQQNVPRNDPRYTGALCP